MKIECPYCQNNTSIEYAEHICCNHCKRSLKDYDYKPIKNKQIALLAASLVAGGAIAGYLIEDAFDQIRYSPQFEYQIITQCANPQNRSYLRESVLQKNIFICSCALEKTIKNIGYKERIDQEFRVSFEKNLRACER